MNNNTSKKYNAVDGLRAIACIGIVLMHVRGNGHYALESNITGIIGSFTFFVSLFLMISAFGMCCGYYKRILDNTISLTDFYKKRFLRVLPYFSILVLIDVCMKPSITKIYEGFADLTLTFGFTLKRMSVIGVAWFLGLIFVFYMIFPFFCVLIENKRRAWIVFVIACIWHFVAAHHFKLDRMNILFSGVFFVVGGLIYLYREQIEKINRWIIFGVIVISMITFYMLDKNYWMAIILFGAMLMYAVSVQNCKFTILDNKVFKFIAGISMEIYLSHMVIFRVVEKLGLTHKFGKGALQYAITTILVLVGSIVFAFVLKKIIEIVGKQLTKLFAKEKSAA